MEAPPDRTSPGGPDDPPVEAVLLPERVEGLFLRVDTCWRVALRDRGVELRVFRRGGGFQQRERHGPIDLQVEQSRARARADVRGAVAPHFQPGNGMTCPDSSTQMTFDPGVERSIAPDLSERVAPDEEVQTPLLGDPTIRMKI